MSEIGYGGGGVAFGVGFEDIGSDGFQAPGLEPLDPQDAAPLMAGGIYLTTTGLTSSAWASQATQANTFSLTATDDPPVVVPGDPPYLDLTAAAGVFFPFLYLASVGDALYGSGTTLSIAFWIRLAEVPPTQELNYVLDWWPNNTARRISIWIHNENGGGVYMSINGSTTGEGIDPNERWKYNGTPRTDWTDWHFVRVTIDMSLANYASGGGNFSNRVKVYIDGVHDPGTGYSAGGAPPAGPVRSPLFGSTDSEPLVLGFLALNQPGNPRFRGYFGHFFFTGGDTDLTDEEWMRVAIFEPFV